jgi:hypothetical protein
VKEVLDAFKERMVMQFKAMTDEFTKSLMGIDTKYSELNNSGQQTIAQMQQFSEQFKK